MPAAEDLPGAPTSCAGSLPASTRVKRRVRPTRIEMQSGHHVRGSSTLNQLLARRALIVLGKGGVGKSTLSAALAMVAADSGTRVLAMECDPRAPMASAFGRPPSFDPVEIMPNFSTMVLDGAH